jgi:hypothetical protein
MSDEDVQDMVKAFIAENGEDLGEEWKGFFEMIA